MATSTLYQSTLQKNHEQNWENELHKKYSKTFIFKNDINIKTIGIEKIPT